jgi:dienelactone hydrolase
MFSMISENANLTKEESASMPLQAEDYDPFDRGRFLVGVSTVQVPDLVRKRLFHCEIWYPAAAPEADHESPTGIQDFFTDPSRHTLRRQAAVRNADGRSGTYPLIVFSHHWGGHRRTATFLCTHLSSHGYVVAALDHSEVVAGELARKNGETHEEKIARVEAVIANRVPDIRFLLDYLLSYADWNRETRLDPARVGVVGYSFGGWAALAAPAVEWRIRAVVALAPAGSSWSKPGTLPIHLSFGWGRDVPTLYLVAEHDTPVPLAGMCELFARAPVTKQMVILRQADHLHFMDDVELEHEAVRRMQVTAESAWVPKEMRPIKELCSGEQAHLFARGLAVCHMDAILRQHEGARHFLAGDIESALAMRGVSVLEHKS